MNNPKPKFSDLSPAEKQAYTDKAARDNRSDQMNPNNRKFHTARQK